jgi:hypothetical protein
MRPTDSALEELDPGGPRMDALLDRFQLPLLLLGAKAMALQPDVALHGYIVDTEGAAGEHLLRQYGRPIGPDPIVGIMPLERVRETIARYRPEVLRWHAEDRGRNWRRLPIVVYVADCMSVAWVWCPVVPQPQAG